MGRLDTEARMIIKVLSSRGTMTSDIARLLDVTERTVRYHLERLHLSAVDGCSRQLFRAEAVAEAIETWRAAQEDGSIWRRCTTGWSANTIMPAACAWSSATGQGDIRLPPRGRAPPVHENMAKPLVTVAESIDLSDGDRREVGFCQVIHPA